MTTVWIFLQKTYLDLYNKHSKRFCVDNHDPEITSWKGVKSIQNTSGFEVIKSDTG
jgi:hypothetical protein